MRRVILNSAKDFDIMAVISSTQDDGTYKVKTPSSSYDIFRYTPPIEEVREQDTLHSMFYVPRTCRYALGQDDDAEQDILTAISSELDMRLAKRYPTKCDYDLGGYYTCRDYEFENEVSNPLYMEDDVSDIFLQLSSNLKDNIKETLLVPVYAYIHGGISLSLGKYNDRFDSGVIGFMAMTSQQLKNANKKTTKTNYLTRKDKALIMETLEGEIKTLNAWLNGEFLLASDKDDDDVCYQVDLDSLEEFLF